MHNQSEITAFRWVRAAAKLSIEDAAHVLRVHPRTVARWESGATSAPWSALLVLHMLGGDLGAWSDDWTGFKMTPRGIYTPEHPQPLTPGLLRAVPYLMALQAEISRRDRQTEPHGIDRGVNIRLLSDAG